MVQGVHSSLDRCVITAGTHHHGIGKDRADEGQADQNTHRHPEILAIRLFMALHTICCLEAGCVDLGNTLLLRALPQPASSNERLLYGKERCHS